MKLIIIYYYWFGIKDVTVEVINERALTINNKTFNMFYPSFQDVCFNKSVAHKDMKYYSPTNVRYEQKEKM